MADSVNSENPALGPKQALSFSSVFVDLFANPVNLVLLGACLFLLYKIFSQRSTPPKIRVELPPLKKQDWTLEQLRPYDGKGPDGRVLLAVNGKVFDVTRGKRFYGPDGPYGVLAGRDASRGLATFSLSEDALRDDYDDLSDLNSMQMDSIKEWEIQFTEKYIYVGKLLKPGEQPTEYTDTEDTEDSSTAEKMKNKDE